MATNLDIALGQFSDAGRKEVNQDFHGAFVPEEDRSSIKGAVAAVADGIGSSGVSQIASEAAVAGFLEDYLSTSEAWTVKKSAHRVIMALNSWLYAQTRRSQYRYDMDRGYVCTLSALVIKARMAHVFHVGDSRIYRARDGQIEQITHDHRTWITSEKSFLGSALGADEHVEVEYHALPVTEGDVFILTTDGVHDWVTSELMLEKLGERPGDPHLAARAIGSAAYSGGSDDNLTVQIVRVDHLPDDTALDVRSGLMQLPFPPLLDARMDFDGYRIIRQLHASNRSHVFLAEEKATGEYVALKALATEMESDPAGVERFLMEEWVAHRVNSPYVVRAHKPAMGRNYVYTVMELVEGQTLTQWMRDNPRPELATVRAIVEQIAKGLRAFHRMEMIHQDLRPDNVMIDQAGTVKLIDFGSTRVAGIQEASGSDQEPMLGTMQYSAPEYFLGETGSARSDIYSLAVITYQMLTGRLPYGTAVPGARTRLAQMRLRYHSAVQYNPALPAWVDVPLRRALHPDPNRRHQALSELLFDLRYPDQTLVNRPQPPLIERNPILFWQLVSALLAGTVVGLTVLLLR